LIKGELQAKEGSTVILAETGVIEGTVHADTLLVYGFIRGDVVVQKRLVLGQTARVIGNIMTQSLSLEFGAYFEGSCKSSPFVEKKA
jgi:cytoskeletal protein CcmA (bactofilin family)